MLAGLPLNVGARWSALERRLHRTWRRCQQVKSQLLSDSVDQRLLDNLLRNAASLVQDGAIRPPDWDVESISAAVTDALHTCPNQLLMTVFKNGR